MVAVKLSTQGAGRLSSLKWCSHTIDAGGRVMGGSPSMHVHLVVHAVQSTRYPVSYLGSAGTMRMTYLNTSSASAYMHSGLAEKGHQQSVTIPTQ